MAGFANINDVVTAEINGQTSFYTWRKTANTNGGAGVWMESSLAAGNPSPQYYASTPLTSTILSRSGDGGIQHGGDVSPLTKVIKKFSIQSSASAAPLNIIVGDVLMFYPFVEESTTSEQVLLNTTSLTRYTDGEGVQIMCVSQSPRAGGRTFTVKYTNQDGVSGRVTTSATTNTSTSNGNIIHSSPATAGTVGPFLPLQLGDTGVRSVESVTMGGADVGLFAVVLFKPLFNTQLRGADAVVETDFIKDNMLLPIVQDDAYLTMLLNPQVNIVGQALHGYIQTVWN